VSGCGASSPGDLDARPGCDTVALTHSTSGPLVILDVETTGCGELGPDVDRVARAVWQSIELPVDAVRVTIPDSPQPTPMYFDREQLDERFGPGPNGVVWPVDERGPADAIWWLLPVAYAAVALMALHVVRRLSKAGVVGILFRR